MLAVSCSPLPPPPPEVSTTLTVADPDFSLLTVEVAVIVHVPFATAVTTPVEASTVATFVLEEDQVTVVAAPWETLTVASKVPLVVPFKSRFKVEGETVVTKKFRDNQDKKTR